MLDAIEELEQDAEAIGTGAKAILQSVCSYQAVVPKETDWRAYPARYVSAKHARPEDEPAALATDYQVRQ
jgi:phthalate 4,5-dioxygenase oxygenase subunit